MPQRQAYHRQGGIAIQHGFPLQPGQACGIGGGCLRCRGLRGRRLRRRRLRRRGLRRRGLHRRGLRRGSLRDGNLRGRGLRRRGLADHSRIRRLQVRGRDRRLGQHRFEHHQDGQTQCSKHLFHGVTSYKHFQTSARVFCEHPAMVGMRGLDPADFRPDCQTNIAPHPASACPVRAGHRSTPVLTSWPYPLPFFRHVWHDSATPLLIQLPLYTTRSILSLFRRKFFKNISLVMIFDT